MPILVELSTKFNSVFSDCPVPLLRLSEECPFGGTFSSPDATFLPLEAYNKLTTVDPHANGIFKGKR
jgi:hypothetical protein